MKTKKSLETKDIALLINVQKMCSETCCANCIFFDDELGCAYSHVKDIIVEKTGMAKQTLNRMISTACEASELNEDD